MDMDPIGFLRTPFTTREGMPIQPCGARGTPGRAELRGDLAPGLQDLEGFSHLILIYLFHQSRGFDLRVVPFLDHHAHGVFATRAPRRPNPIGLSVVRLDRIEGATLHLLDVDMLDGTPLLDIKPFVPGFDVPVGPVRAGWLEDSSDRAPDTTSDGRFA